MTDSSVSEFDRGYQRALADLAWLGDARARYLHVDVDTVHSLDQLSDTDRTLYIETRTARHLGAILTGDNDGAGWLPSWLWDDWAERRRA